MNVFLAGASGAIGRPLVAELVRRGHTVTGMTRSDAGDFLQIASEINLRPKVTAFPLDQVNQALLAVKNDSIDGAAVILP